MKNSFMKSPLCEYYLLICPSEEVKNEVKQMKLSFLKEYGSFPGQNSNAHISLMSFFQQESREEKLVYSVCEAMKKCNEFDLFLNGFGFSHSDNTFFIDILDKQPIIHLYHQLRTELFKQLVSISFLRKGFLPQLTLGRTISSMQYFNAFREYQEKPYTNNFRVFSLTVLKRTAPFSRWEKLVDIPVGNPIKELW